MFAANNSVQVHSGIRFTPSELLLGFTSPVSVVWKRKPEPVYNDEDVVALCRRGAQTSWEIAPNNLCAADRNSKRYHDKSLNQH